jgi:DNA helicase-2/ATP-dependent DNA helicase PcrA
VDRFGRDLLFSDARGKRRSEAERRYLDSTVIARDKLFLSSCRKRRRQKDFIERKPSPFLQEIPAHLIEAREIFFSETSEDGEGKTSQGFFARMRARLGG